MRIAKIKNKYMYKTSESDNGVHFYLIYYDRKKKCYCAVQLTHLYIKDKDRFIQVNKGNIKLEKFKEFEVPSGVRKDVYTKNSKGTKINIKDKTNVVFVSKRYLSSKQSGRIISFIKNKTKS